MGSPAVAWQLGLTSAHHIPLFPRSFAPTCAMAHVGAKLLGKRGMWCAEVKPSCQATAGEPIGLANLLNYHPIRSRAFLIVRSIYSCCRFAFPLCVRSRDAI